MTKDSSSATSQLEGYPVILFIDDSTMMHTVLSRKIVEILPNAKVICLGSVTAAKESLSQCTTLPWLLITDYNMGDGNGIDLLEWVKLDPRLHSLPVVLISSQIEPKTVVQASLLGAMNVVRKPINEKELGAVFKRRTSIEGRLKEMYEKETHFANVVMEFGKGLRHSFNTSSDEERATLQKNNEDLKSLASLHDYPHLALACGYLTEFFAEVTRNNVWNKEPVKEVASEMSAYFMDQSTKISSRATLNALPPNVLQHIRLLEIAMSSGLFAGIVSALDKEKNLRKLHHVDLPPSDWFRLFQNIESLFELSFRMRQALTALTKSPTTPELSAEMTAIANSLDSIAKNLSEVVAHRTSH